MESNFEGALAVNKKPKKENIINRIVVENFGDWRSFRNTVKDAWENVVYDPRENKSSRHRFIREILQSNAGKISADDFKKLSNLIIEEINIFERRKEKTEVEKGGEKKSAKEKYVQRDISFGDRQGA